MERQMVEYYKSVRDMKKQVDKVEKEYAKSSKEIKKQKRTKPGSIGN